MKTQHKAACAIVFVLVFVVVLIVFFVCHSLTSFVDEQNVRDTGIESRSGLFIQAKKIRSIQEILNQELSLVGIDEIHMFEPTDAQFIGELLSQGTDVIVSGLDTDYRGELFEMTKKLFGRQSFLMMGLLPTNLCVENVLFDNVTFYT